ncbi:MAG: putative periplasmic phospholipid-binding protein [Betaproteobacteria bacterium]|nr:putative periplasmic phospholipid-binding protein [Betaproteobacteria bacterium]
MQTLTRSFNLILIVILLGMIFTSYGCSKADDNGETVGQKLDRSVDKTSAAADQAGRQIEDAARQADRKIQREANKAEDKFKDATASMRDNSADKSGTRNDTKGEIATVVDDSAITASVKADMLKDPALSVMTVDVSTDRGEVTLKGSVKNAAAKRRAEEVAHNVSGVQKVNNELQVAANDKSASAG